jgi:nitroreductase
MNTRPVSTDTLLQQLQWRYATKVFDPTRKISEADWSVLEQALILSASSYGMQPYRFLVISDPAVREKLLPAAWGQRQVVDASHFIVFARRNTTTAADVDEFIHLTASTRGMTPESLSAFRDVIVGDVVSGRAARWPRSGQLARLILPWAISSLRQRY